MTKAVKNLLLLLVKAYQKLVSPYLAPRCRFYPSCSKYAVDALGKYSLPKSLLKIIWRLVRCNPFFPGGVDPA